MRREISWGEEALTELEAASQSIEVRSAGREAEFVTALEAVMFSLTDFPLQGSPVETKLTVPIRRISVRPFAYLLYYTVYPSIDFQTGEALDIIHFLACRHEKQGTPSWSSRDPFRSP